MPHEDYCYALERENHALNEKYESLRQQLDGWIAANSPNGWIDDLRQQLSTLKAELKCIGEAIDDPRTDLTMTMSEVIVDQKQQLSAAQAKIDELMLEYCPEEMTQEQIAEYEKHQRAVTEPKL